jgi:hypothetical protein
MHSAAARAKQRREQEEAEREAQKERARRKAQEIEERMKASQSEKEKEQNKQNQKKTQDEVSKQASSLPATQPSQASASIKTFLEMPLTLNAIVERHCRLYHHRRGQECAPCGVSAGEARSSCIETLETSWRTLPWQTTIDHPFQAVCSARERGLLAFQHYFCADASPATTQVIFRIRRILHCCS